MTIAIYLSVLFVIVIFSIMLLKLISSIKNSPVVIDTNVGLKIIVEKKLFKKDNDYKELAEEFVKFIERETKEEVAIESVSVYIVSEQPITLKRGDKIKYNGLTISKNTSRVYVENKNTDIRKTAFLYEIFNLIIWNRFGYSTALTEGNMENAKRFLDEKTAEECIERRKFYDIAYKKWNE